MRMLICALAIAACRQEYYSDKPYDARVDCVVGGVETAATLDEASAVADVNQDGYLTDADLRPGETTSIIRIEGRHNGTGLPSPEGYTVHTTFHAEFVEVPHKTDVWGVEQQVLNCFPDLGLGLWFNLDDDAALPVIGAVEHISAVTIYSMVWGMIDDQTIADGDATVTRFDPQGASGFFEGLSSIDLYAQIPEPRKTGQTVVVEAMAWRDLPLQPAR